MRLMHFGIGGGCDQRLFERLGDQPGAAVECDVRPRPLDHDQQAIAKSDQEQDVDEQPEQPGEVGQRL